MRIIVKEFYLLTIVEHNQKQFQGKFVSSGHLKYLKSKTNPFLCLEFGLFLSKIKGAFRHGLTPENYPGQGLGNHNYCRNPDNEPGGAWCYTMDPSQRWEYCACPLTGKSSSQSY